MPAKLTDATVQALTVKSSAYFVWDSQATGLGVKVTPAKRKLFVVQLRFPGHTVQTKRTLGQWPGMALHDARLAAQRWRDQVKVGIDPRLVEAEQRRAAEREAANTFARVVEQYLAARTAYRRYRTDKKEIERKLIPAFGDRPISTIMPRDVREYITAQAKVAPYSTSNTWRHAVAIFKFAAHNDMIAASPCASLTKRLLFNGHTLPPRQRVLSDEEVARLWHVTDELGYPYGHFYRWLLMTGCRLSEAQGARWSEINGSTWTIPPERFKSNAEHALPITDAMLELLATIPRQGDYLFTCDGMNPINGATKVKRMLDREMGDVPAWVNHDLRRTVRTNLAALGVADHVAELVIGHGRRGLQRIYDRHKYTNEIEAALTAWHACIERLRLSAFRP